MVSTITFSEMTAGGDLANGDLTPGLLGGANVLFNNPWTFLASGSTASRPPITSAIYYRLRFNTDSQTYEYYDAVTSAWVEVSGSGTGTVNPGLINNLAYYAGPGQTLSPISSAASSVLITSSGSVPSLSTTLPSGLTIPGATITSSTAALSSGQVVAAPTNPTDLANKAYVDAQVPASNVPSIQGTANQVLVNGTSGSPVSGTAVTLTTPQNIGTGSSPTFVGMNLSSTINGITGISNTGGSLPIVTFSTIASAVNYLNLSNQISGQAPIIFSAGTDTNISMAFTAKGNGMFYLQTTNAAPLNFITGTAYQHFTQFVFANTANSNYVTWPDSSGTVAYTSQLPTGAALTETNDTNVTLTLGGTPSTALLQATSITAGWTGQLAISRGGTGVASVTSTPAASSWAGWDANSNLSANNLIPSLTTTASSGITIALTVASTQVQIITGSTPQIITMPVVSTLPKTGFPFYILNNSSANITIESSGSNVIGTIAPGSEATVTCVSLTGTTAASWFLFQPSFTPSALSEVNDTNVTMTLTGSPTVALLQPVIMTMGWAGQLSLARGGTNAALTAANGAIPYSTASAMALLAPTATAQQLLVSGANSAPQWTTSSYPLTNAVNTLLYASSANTMSALATANNSVLVTSAGGVPSLSTSLPSGLTIPGFQSSITFGTGVQTALGINIGSAGAPITFNGALGTPSSGTLTNATGLPIAGITGLGTGVGTALAANVNGTGAISLTTSATFVTPILGVATATSINFGGSTLSTYTSETSWTPVFTFATPGNLSVSYATQIGVYTQIGSVVYYFYRVVCTPTFTTASGVLSITGIGLTSSSSYSSQIGPAIGFGASVTWPAGTTSLISICAANTNYFGLFGIASTGNTQFASTNFVSGVACTISGQGFFYV